MARLPAGTRVAHFGLGAARATVIKKGRDDTINCTLSVGDPHYYAEVQVAGTITCSATVSYLSVSADLYRNGSLVASGTNENTNMSIIHVVPMTPCVAGTYQGDAYGLVEFPDGYQPPSSDFGGQTVYSNSVNITC
jgi:hypothetical protein